MSPNSSFPILQPPKGQVDPVCHMTVDPEKAAGATTYRAQDLLLLQRNCLARFSADPERYLAPEAPPSAMVAPKGGEYTCPMHPEVRQSGPGACSKCGMSLEPVDAAQSEANPELADMQWRLLMASLLSAPIVF